MRLDELKTELKSVTIYGENSNKEDFAESVAEYVENPKMFSSKFQNRAKLLKKLLEWGEQ